MANIETKNNMLDLSHLPKVAQGKNRDVYLIPAGHPVVTGAKRPMVLKVPRYAARNARQSLPKKILRHLFPTSLKRVIRKEARYRQKLDKSAGRTIESVPVPAFHGFVDTNKGGATLWEAICDDSGRLAQTLEDLAARGDIKKALEPLNQFARDCFACNLVGADINDHNLVLTRENKKLRVILVDGFGDHRMISIRSLWPPRNWRCLNSRFQKVARKTGLYYDERARVFSAPA